MSTNTQPTPGLELPLIVAIDGPAGAGKSTIARGVAEKLGVPYLDTGAMYRSVTWAALERGIDITDADKVHHLAATFNCRITPDSVIIDDHDATAGIRSPEVTAAVSAVSAHPGVREVLRAQQRAWAVAAGGGVMEGRDIGTVVFPDATIKIFLTASIAERARRRALESGEDATTVEADMRRRDAADSTRTHAPLQRADDATEVDTTDLSPQEAIDRIVGLALAAAP